MGLGSWSAAAKRPFVTSRKAFLSPWTGSVKNGEGCGERMKEEERERRAPSSLLGWPVSFESFEVRHGVLVERGFSFFSLCHRVVFMVASNCFNVLRCNRRTCSCDISFRDGASSPASVSTRKQTLSNCQCRTRRTEISYGKADLIVI